MVGDRSKLLKSRPGLWDSSPWLTRCLMVSNCSVKERWSAHAPMMMLDL